MTTATITKTINPTTNTETTTDAVAPKQPKGRPQSELRGRPASRASCAV